MTQNETVTAQVTETETTELAPVVGEILPAEKGDPRYPQVGDAATAHQWSDSWACTVVAVSKSGKTITLRRDHAKLLNGANSSEPDALKCDPGGFAAHFSGTQRWAYTSNPDGQEVKATLRTYKDTEWVDGRRVTVEKTCWVQVGCSTRQRGGGVTVGRRSEHYDFNF